MVPHTVRDLLIEFILYAIMIEIIAVGMLFAVHIHSRLRLDAKIHRMKILRQDLENAIFATDDNHPIAHKYLKEVLRTLDDERRLADEDLERALRALDEERRLTDKNLKAHMPDPAKFAKSEDTKAPVLALSRVVEGQGKNKYFGSDFESDSELDNDVAKPLIHARRVTPTMRNSTGIRYTAKGRLYNGKYKL